MHHTTVSLLVLEVQEPVLTVFGVYPTALMRAVDVGLSLCQYDLMLVRAKRTLAAHGQLETFRHTAGRTHDPVPAVTLIKLRSLTGAVRRAVSIKHNHRIADRFQAVRRHLTNGEHRGKL